MVSIGEAFSYVFGGTDQHKMIPKRLNWTLPVDRNQAIFVIAGPKY
jgi:hypothetical protein